MTEFPSIDTLKVVSFPMSQRLRSVRRANLGVAGGGLSLTQLSKLPLRS